MTNHVMLNNVDHKDLKVLTTRSAELGDNVMSAVTFPDEFRNVQAEYPIVFQKGSEAGQFHSLALFGFEQGENLYLDESGWDAIYLPLTVEQQPFLIGFQEQVENGVPAKQPVIHFDLDSPRVGETEGETVFLPHGGLTEFLERINAVLHTVHDGIARQQPFVDLLTDLDLLESFTLDVTLDDGSEYRLAGYYTINEDRLRELGDESVSRLRAEGFLEPVYMVIASLSNLRKLITRRNARLKA